MPTRDQNRASRSKRGQNCGGDAKDSKKHDRAEPLFAQGDHDHLVRVGHGEDAKRNPDEGHREEDSSLVASVSLGFALKDAEARLRDAVDRSSQPFDRGHHQVVRLPIQSQRDSPHEASDQQAVQLLAATRSRVSVMSLPSLTTCCMSTFRLGGPGIHRQSAHQATEGKHGREAHAENRCGQSIRSDLRELHLSAEQSLVLHRQARPDEVQGDGGRDDVKPRVLVESGDRGGENDEQDGEIWWLEHTGNNNWDEHQVASMNQADYGLSSQGYRAGQIIAGGKQELVISDGSAGIYTFTIASPPTHPWTRRLVANATGETSRGTMTRRSNVSGQTAAHDMEKTLVKSYFFDLLNSLFP